MATNGADTITGTLGDDIIDALGGRDTINATQGVDVVDGGPNLNDRLTIIMSDPTRFATAASGSRTYIIDNGHAGSSSGGLDTSFVNIERVTLELNGTGDFGDTVDSTAFSGGFALDIRLGHGDDIVNGGAGNETVFTRLGTNWVDTGAGFDVVYTQTDFTAGTTVTIAGSGNMLQTVHNGVVTNTILNAEQVFVGNNVDAAFVVDGLTYTVDASGYTGSAQIVFYDHNGDDVFVGSAGSDIFSNLYNATVGNDTYTGNGGADIYDYTVAVNALNNDVITDFDNDDVIDFQYNDGIIVPGQLLANDFISGGAFTGVAGQYRFEASGGQTFVQIDTDGDMVADRTLTMSNGQYGLVETAPGSNILMRATLFNDINGDGFRAGTLGNDVINMLGGNDFIAATRGIDFVDGGTGFDQLRFIMSNTGRFATPTEARTYTITADHVSDSSGQLNTSFADVEQVYLTTVNTGNFGDTIDGSAAGASLLLRLGNGNDTVIGGAGDDDIATGLGINNVDAGGGNDLVNAQFDNTLGATAYVTMAGGAVVTTVDGIQVNSVTNAETVAVHGLNFNAATTTIDASGLTGFAGLFAFFDNNGSNISIGSAGSDLFANVHGGEAGNDVYTGNGGADIYDYTWAIGAMDRDTITDFDADDTIDLSHNTATQNGGGLLATTFLGSSAFTGVAGQYRYYASGGQTFVQVDTSGDGIADETLTIANGEFGLVQTAPGSNILMRANLITRTEGNDFGPGTLGNDVINALGGNDHIGATSGIDFIDGGEGTDQINVIMSDASRFAAATGSRTYTLTADRLSDSSGVLNTSFTGVERILLRTDANGNFGDTIDASGLVLAPGGYFVLRAGTGNDTIIGSAGDDDLSGGLGINTIDAGGGYDIVHLRSDSNAGTVFVTMSDGALITTVGGVQTNSVVNGEAFYISSVDFNSALTTVNASGLIGFTGTLVFFDNNGSNVSIGSSGGDLFANVHGGEAGNDVYTGNGGADIYDYTWAIGAMDRDTITDFDADDVIDLQYNTATQNGGGLLATTFLGSSAFTGVAGQYRYYASGGQTFVQVDTSGDGIADETLTIANGQFALGETAAGSNILMMIGTSGTNGNNTLTGTLGNDNIYAQAGSDTINGSEGTDFIDGGAGTDYVRFILSNSALFDTPTGSRSFTITASSISDASGSINTSIANVERIGLSTIGNGDFGDTVDASAWTSVNINSTLIITLGNGDDTVIGSVKNDIITTGLGNNSVDAGDGFDDVRVTFDNSAGGTLYLNGSGTSLTTTLDGAVTNTVLNAEMLAVIGSDFNGGLTSIVAAGVTGFAGTLIFYDNNGSNNVIGSNGGDIFANVHGGEAGNDSYTGNGGADIYDYTYAVGAMDRDLITDFDADDVIDLQYNNATQNGGGLLATQFIGAGNFTGVAGQYRYFASGGQTFVQVDTNGDTVADETLTIGNGQFALGETAPGSNILKMIGASGTSANDTLTGTLGDDSIYAQQGNDNINGSQGADFIDGGAWGGDRLFMNTGTASLFTAATGARTYTIGNGTITDSSGTLNTSFTGVERVAFSTVGNGDFNDIIDASGFVSAHGTPLDIRLGNGDNQVTGSSVNDRIFTGFGSTIVDGGAGYDRGFANVDSSIAATVVITNVGGTLVTNAGGVINSFTNVEEIWVNGVGTGAITLDASAYTAIAGVALVLVGHNGTDIMIGSTGNDYFANITGQVLGNDVYTGNGGADIYDYTWAADSMNGDTITDFDIDDVIDFRFNNLELGGSPLLCNSFIGAAAFNGIAGEYRYQIDGTQTVIQLDSNGDSVADQVVTISNGAFMLAETFLGSNILTLADPIDELEVIVSDGYLANATVFIDTDGDQLLDAGEAWTTTDGAGHFVLNVNQAGTLVAFGGTNIDTGLANTMTLAAPSGSGVVNPLTTLVQAVVEASNGTTSAAQAEDMVLAALGLDPSLDLFNLDLIAAAASDPAALEAQKAAAMIANLVAAAEGTAGAGATAESLLVGALAELVTGGGATIDLTDAATLTPLLTEALPGVTNVAAIAGEAALQAETISAATSVDAISDAQSDAQLIDYSLDNIRTGDGAANFLYGLGGNDTLYGLGGNDRLVGGDGLDHLYGGAGNDIFVAEATPTTITTKLGTMSFDVIFDFARGEDKIDLGSLDANSLIAGHQAFTWKGSNANKAAADLSFKVYASVQGAEKALGIDIDGVAGASPYLGPVTIVYGNLNGGTPDFALALIGVNGVTQSDFLFV